MNRILLFFSLMAIGLAKPNVYSDNNLKLGIDVIEENQFSYFKPNDKIGILTHGPATNSKKIPTYRVFLNSKIKEQIHCFFCPEHGLSGTKPAGQLCANEILDGIPVYSLYSNEEKPKWAPTKEQLAQIDVLVIDLADVGVRCYTYITCMRFALEQCIRYGKRVIILDRPNPLGRKVSGPFINKELQGYVGGFLIPHLHGMTMGELAKMIINDYQEHPWLTPLTKEELANAKENDFLTVIKMENYKPDSLWNEQNWDSTYSWVPTSPNIPCFESALYYSCMTAVSIYGNLKTITFDMRTDPNNLKIQPFRFIRVESQVNVQKICDELNEKKLPGVQFEMISHEKDEKGICLTITDWQTFNPGLCILALIGIDATLENPKKYQVLADDYSGVTPKRPKEYIDVARAIMGDYEWIQDLVNNDKQQFNEERINYFLKKWENECKAFEEKRKAWVLYF